MQRKRRVIVGLTSFMSVSVVIGGAVGTYFGLAKTNPPYLPVKDREEQIVDKCEPIIYSDLVPWLPDLSIRQYPFKIADGQYKYYFTKKEMWTLINRWLAETNYGPEIFMLKELSINNQNLIEGANGRFFPSSGQLGIYAVETEDNKWLTSAQKIEQAFEILYHEYGHLIYYSYMANVLPGIDDLPYQKLNNQIVSSSFIEQFKTDFTYDQTKEVGDIVLNDDVTPVSKHIYEKELFDFANHQKAFPYPEQTYIFGTYPDSSGAHLLGGGGFVGATPSWAKYIYSIEELWTRKYMLATMPFSQVAQDMLNPNLPTYHENPGLAMLVDYENYSSTFFNDQDIEDLSLEKWREGLVNIGTSKEPDFFEVHNYYQDNPFLPSLTEPTQIIAQQMAEQVSSWMGANNSKQLSSIFFRNVEGYDDYSQVDKKEQSPSDGDFVKLSGYLDQNLINQIGQNQVYLATKKDETLTKIAPLTLVNKEIKYKNSVFNDKSEKIANNGETFWIMQDYVDAKTFANQKLYFVWADQSVPLTSYRGQTDYTHGVASSWNRYYPNYDPSSIQFDVYQGTIIDGGGVAITSAGKWNDFYY